MLLCEFILNSQPAPPGEPFLLRTLLELYLADALPDEAAGGGGGDDAVTRVPAASTKVRRCFVDSSQLSKASPAWWASRCHMRNQCPRSDAVVNPLCKHHSGQKAGLRWSHSDHCGSAGPAFRLATPVAEVTHLYASTNIAIAKTRQKLSSRGLGQAGSRRWSS